MIDTNSSKYRELIKYSNPIEVQKRAYQKFGKDKGELWISSRKDKKYMVHDGNKFIHFGQMDYEDFTKHKNTIRRENYKRRASNIRGNWRENPLSPNNLSIHLLW